MGSRISRWFGLFQDGPGRFKMGSGRSFKMGSRCSDGGDSRYVRGVSRWVQVEGVSMGQGGSGWVREFQDGSGRFKRGPICVRSASHQFGGSNMVRVVSRWVRGFHDEFGLFEDGFRGFNMDSGCFKISLGVSR